MHVMVLVGLLDVHAWECIQTGVERKGQTRRQKLTVVWKTNDSFHVGFKVCRRGSVFLLSPPYFTTTN